MLLDHSRNCITAILQKGCNFGLQQNKSNACFKSAPVQGVFFGHPSRPCLDVCWARFGYILTQITVTALILTGINTVMKIQVQQSPRASVKEQLSRAEFRGSQWTNINQNDVFSLIFTRFLIKNGVPKGAPGPGPGPTPFLIKSFIKINENISF